MRSSLQYYLFGILFLGLAFLAGAQESFLWGLAGFLPFFLVGITLIVEGLKRRKRDKE